MRALKSSIGAILLILTITLFLMIKTTNRSNLTESRSVHVVLIGASIGQGWHLAEWPSRVREDAVTTESVPAWQFDKSEVLQEVLMRPRRKFHPTRSYLKSLFRPPLRSPDVMIIKECSSYFPGDLSRYESSIQDWVSRALGRHMIVVLATVVPVTRARAQQDPGKQLSLLQYNEWIRAWAAQNGLHVLDLESALNDGSNEKFLRDEFANPDGSHLNAAAYSVLDGLLQSVLHNIMNPTGKHSPPTAAR